MGKPMSIPIFPCCSWKNHDKSLWNPLVLMGFSSLFPAQKRPSFPSRAILPRWSLEHLPSTHMARSASAPMEVFLSRDRLENLVMVDWMLIMVMILMFMVHMVMFFCWEFDCYLRSSSREILNSFKLFFWWSGDRFLVSWGFDLSKLLWSIVEYSLWSFYSHVRHVSHVCICGQLRLMMSVFQLSRTLIQMKSVQSPCWKSDRSKIVLCAVPRPMVSRLPRGIWATDRRRQGADKKQNWQEKLCRFYWLTSELLDGWLLIHVDPCKYNIYSIYIYTVIILL